MQVEGIRQAMAKAAEDHIKAQVVPPSTTSACIPLQEYLAYKKPPPPRTLQYDYA